MRRFLRVLPLLLLALACAKTTLNPSVRLDFVGSNRFTSSTRTLSLTPADTLASKIYAETGDTSTLRELKITLTSLATRTPVIYPVTGYKPVADPPLTYLDSLLPKGTKDLAFINLLSSRTTSGSDLWEYSATDSKGSTASRAYRLTLRRPDSVTAVVHSYRLFMSPVPYTAPRAAAPPLTPAQNRALAYVGLRPGLLLPHFSVASKGAKVPNPNQKLVDLVCIVTGADIRLASTASPKLVVANDFRNATLLRATTLGLTGFPNLTTTVTVRNAFSGGALYSAAGGTFAGDTLVTAPLVKGDVIAFKTKDNKYGALFVADLVRTPTATITCQVVVEK